VARWNKTLAKMIDRHWDGIAAYCKLENKVRSEYVEGLTTTSRVVQGHACG
jgi:hypothetical protein